MILENDMNEAAQEVYRTMAALAKGKNLEFRIEKDEDVPRASFDKDKIIQVLMNLVNNAIKFTDKGSVLIKTTSEKDAIHVSVSDTGPGIRDEDKEKVFQEFTELSTGSKRKTGGTGLGLAISKLIIKDHSGALWFDSRYGKGSTFTFSIPMAGRERGVYGDGVSASSSP